MRVGLADASLGKASMVSDTLYLVHRKPQVGLPVLQGFFDTGAAAVEHMGRLVSARTATGNWAVVTRRAGADGRDVLLRSSDGSVEAFFICEQRGGRERLTLHP